jgi:hypothetical protein
LKKKVAERIQQEEDVFDSIPERNRIEFEIRPDREFLDKYILVVDGTLDLKTLEIIASDQEEETSVRNMANAIISMREWWKEKEEKEDDFQNYIKNFVTIQRSGQARECCQKTETLKRTRQRRLACE